MILSYVSLFLMAYALIRFVFPLSCDPFVKLFIATAIIVISRKFQIYEWIGGFFFSPSLPRPILLGMELSYTALLFLVLLLLTRDILLLLLCFASRVGIRWHLPFSPDMQRVGLAFVAITLSSFGVWQSIRVPDVHTVELTVPNLPQQLDGFSLVQLSDLHIGPLLKGTWVHDVVAKTNALDPDVVVLTGDMIDGDPKRLKQEVQPLAKIVARHGVYGVTGNHEYYYGAHAWSSVFKKLGVDMLCNEHRVISVGEADLVIAGVPDPRAERFGDIPPDLEKALKDAPNTTCILLTHQPSLATHSQNVDIQLSGHTHGGIMFFLKHIVASFNNGFVQGLYKIRDKKLYISSGTGIWNGFSCRIGVPSEITHIVLHPE